MISQYDKIESKAFVVKAKALAVKYKTKVPSREGSSLPNTIEKKRLQPG